MEIQKDWFCRFRSLPITSARTKQSHPKRVHHDQGVYRQRQGEIEGNRVQAGRNLRWVPTG
jgi:hypothetical protein